MRAIIITISDRCACGVREDHSGPAVRRLLEAAGHQILGSSVIPDEQPLIEAALRRCVDDEGAELVVTTGGTGLGPRDVTPEATRRVIEREVPGFAEAMRVGTAMQSPRAWLSRGIAGLRGRALIVNLPGNPQAVEECLAVLLPLLPHAAQMLDGHGHD